MLPTIPEHLLTPEFILGKWSYPSLMWRAPGQMKYDHADHSERQIATLIAERLKWEVVSFSTGFNPEYDFILRDSEGELQKCELKMTERHECGVELGRPDGTQSGLSATAADLYFIVTRDCVEANGAISHYKGKLRCCTPALLADASAATKLKSSLGNADGPGSVYFKLDPNHQRVAWLGDVDCVVEDGLTKYNLTEFTTIGKAPLNAIGLIERELQAVWKMKQRLKESECL